jgi:surface protein
MNRFKIGVNLNPEGNSASDSDAVGMILDIGLKVIKPIMDLTPLKLRVNPKYLPEEINVSNLGIDLGFAGSFTIDWGDGVVNSQSAHTYELAGEYIVSITGTISSNIETFTLKSTILEVIQWGTDCVISSASGLFMGAAELTSLPNTTGPNFAPNVVTIGMFYGCINLNAPLNHWDTSNVISMGGMFSGCASFNQPLNSWDTSNVTEMDNMFSNATTYSQDISGWNVDNVISYDYFDALSSLLPEQLPIFGNVVTEPTPSAITTLGNGKPWKYQYELNDSDPIIGPWVVGNSTGTRLHRFQSIVTNNQVYMMGGTDQDMTVSLIKNSFIDITGKIKGISGNLVSLDNFGLEPASGLPKALTDHQIITFNDRVYVFGGSDDVYSDNLDVMSAPITPKGDIGNWITESLQLPQAAIGSQAMIVGDKVYLITDNILTANITDQGIVGPWVVESNIVPTEVQYMSSVAVVGTKFYLIGGENKSTGDNYNAVYSASIDSAGVVSEWTTESSFPISISRTQVVVTGNKILILGGDIGSSRLPKVVSNKVYYTEILPNGDIGNWVQDSNLLPEALSESQVVITEGYINLLGGATTGYDDVRTVFSAPFIGGKSNYTRENGIIDINEPLSWRDSSRYSVPIDSDKFTFVIDTTKAIVTPAFDGGSDYDVNNTIINLDFTGTFVIDWGDGTVNSLSSHTYAEAGEYVISISGNVASTELDRRYITGVLRWGTEVTFNQFSHMFQGAEYLRGIPLNSAPNLGPACELTNTFSGCVLLNNYVNHWDITNVTSMRSMFSGCVSFNQPLIPWDTSNVTDMSNMFLGATVFNQYLAIWDVSNVVDYVDFSTDSALVPENLPLFITDVQPLPMEIIVDTRVTLVFPMGPEDGFSFGVDPSNTSINLGLTGTYEVDWGDGTVNSNVSTHNYGSAGISTVKISGSVNVTENPNGPPPFKAFITNVVDWGDLEIINGETLLAFSSITTLPLASKPNFAVGSSSALMLVGCLNLNSDLSHWDTSTVVNMNYMFGNATEFNQDLSMWDVSNVLFHEDFGMGSKLQPSYYPVWTDVPVYTPDSGPMLIKINTFGLLSSSSPSRDIDLNLTGNFTVDWGDGTVNNNVSTHTYAVDKSYYVSISGNVSRREYISGDRNWITDILNWGGTCIINDGSSMFYGADLFDLPTDSSPTFGSGAILNRFFYRCANLDGVVNHWDVSNVVDMRYMFSDCRSFNQPINNWNVSNVTDLGGLFRDCRLFNQPIGNWNISNVTNIGAIFNGADSFNQPLNGWNTSKVTRASGIFWGASAFNQPLSNWDVSNVTIIQLAFSDATAFSQDLSMWDVAHLTTPNDYDRFNTGGIMSPAQLPKWGIAL